MSPGCLNTRRMPEDGRRHIEIFQNGATYIPGPFRAEWSLEVSEGICLKKRSLSRSSFFSDIGRIQKYRRIVLYSRLKIILTVPKIIFREQLFVVYRLREQEHWNSTSIH